MAGNSDNASLWADADVYVAPVGTAIPTSASTPFAAAWTLCGLLDGGDGFTQSRNEDTADFYAWGGILVRTSRKNFKLTDKFSLLEDNAVTRGLIWPGSTDTSLIVPRPQPVLYARELREGTKVKRLITAKHAVIEVDGDLVENESDLTKYGMIATIYPTSAGVLFTRQFIDTAAP